MFAVNIKILVFWIYSGNVQSTQVMYLITILRYKCYFAESHYSRLIGHYSWCVTNQRLLFAGHWVKPAEWWLQTEKGCCIEAKVTPFEVNLFYLQSDRKTTPQPIILKMLIIWPNNRSNNSIQILRQHLVSSQNIHVILIYGLDVITMVLWFWPGFHLVIYCVRIFALY